MRRLRPEDHDRIHAAVAAVEQRTHARFALTVVPASDRYLMYPLAWAGVAALITAGAIAVFWPSLGVRAAFAVTAAVFVAISLLGDWLPLRVLLVPKRVRHARAADLAHREFAARFLSHPERHVGVLFFVSLAERYVEVLADRELHARAGAEIWHKIVGDFTARAGDGRIADGFVAGVEACGTVLETHYPRTNPPPAG